MSLILLLSLIHRIIYLIITCSSCSTTPASISPHKPELHTAFRVRNGAADSGTDVGRQASNHARAAATSPACCRTLVGSQSLPMVVPWARKSRSGRSCSTDSEKVQEGTTELGFGRWGMNVGCWLLITYCIKSVSYHSYVLDDSI